MMDDGRARATGSCLCGAIRFAIHGALRDVSYCHCLMCQRTLSHDAAYTACAPEALVVVSRRRLRWYRSTPRVRRGFCGTCGSQLFWESEGSDHVSISAGSLDQPTGLRPGRHIFVEHIADYDQQASADQSPNVSKSADQKSESKQLLPR